MTNAEEAPNRRPSVPMTLLLLVSAAVYMVGFFGLYWLLGVDMPYFGLLFLVYWTGVMQQDPKAYLPTIFGGLAGILLGWVLIAIPSLFGQTGLILSMTVLAAVLFCYMRGHAMLVINNATMLFVTVATITELHISGNAVMMVKSLLTGACFVGAVTMTVLFISKLSAKSGGADLA